MYEKIKIQNEMRNAAADGGLSDFCSICDRDKSVVICSRCGHSMKDVRARKKCDIHKNAFFLMDIANCVKCKSPDLLEVGLDDIPERFHIQLVVPSPPRSSPPDLAPPPPSSSGPQVSFSFAQEPPSSPVSMEVVTSSFQHLSTPRVQSETIVRGLKRARGSRVVLPAGAGFQAKNLTSNPGVVGVQISARTTEMQGTTPSGISVTNSANERCICGRSTEFVMCSNCGYYESGARKYIKCPKHPDAKNGMKFCPECGASGDKLDEQ